MIVTKTVEQLVAETRTMSGLSLIGEDPYENTDILGFLNDAQDELDDQFALAGRQWRRKTFPFELTGNTNALDLATDVPDYQSTLAVDDTDDPEDPRNVDRLGSFEDRNRVVTKHYFESGNQLLLYGRNVAGRYALHYVPQSLPFSLPVTQTVSINAADTNPPVPPGLGPGFWAFANLDFSDVPADGTATVTPTFDAPNDVNNLTYHINGLAPGQPHECSTSEAIPANVTGPAAGTVSLVYQPVGTVAELPVLMAQWETFLKLHASIAIREAQGMDTTALERKFKLQTDRIKSMAAKRSAGVVQPPLTRHRHNLRLRYPRF
jgi:hypothetical protein